MALSPATIRNVMADLTDAGLLFAPHTSAGRLPTDRGLRLFVDGLLHFGELTEEERSSITAALAAPGAAWRTRWREASTMLSGLSAAAGLVLAPKSEGAAEAHRVRAARPRPGAGGAGRRRRPGGKPGDRDARPACRPRRCSRPATTSNARLSGRTLPNLRRLVTEEIAANRTELDALSAKVVEAGLATWTGDGARRQPDRARPGAACCPT